jgi:hypothetical protein
MVFGLLDVALLTAGAALWCRIANQVHLSPQAKVIGFIGLFVNFAVLKFATYYTILTDTAALALGIATLYCWLTNWRVGLYLVIVAGAFTWPTVAYQAALLLLFPSPGDRQSTAPAAGVDRVLAFLRKKQRLMATTCRVWSWLQPPNLWLALVAALAVGVACIRFWRMDPNGGPMNGWYTPIQHLMPLSVLFAAGFIFLGLLILWDSRRVFTAAYWLHAFRWRDLFGVGGLLVGIAILQSRLAPQDMATDFVLEFTITGAIKAPAEFLVAHLMYVGPIIAVIILYWKRTSDLIRNYGGGLLLVTSLVLFMSLRSETRTLLNFLPVFVLVAAQALDSQGEWSVTRIALFAALSVLLSSVWLPINSRFETYYFMHQGPYMARWTYYVFLAIAILTMACVYALFKPRSNAVVDATRNEGA